MRFINGAVGTMGFLAFLFGILGGGPNFAWGGGIVWGLCWLYSACCHDVEKRAAKRQAQAQTAAIAQAVRDGVLAAHSALR